jgi:hypothetical protein
MEPNRVRVPVFTTGRATGHAAAKIAGVYQFPGALALSIIGLSRFLHRHGFTGQRRLAQEEILGDQQPHVGRYDGTGLHQDDITRYNVSDLDFGLYSVAQDQSPRLNTFAKGLDSAT